MNNWQEWVVGVLIVLCIARVIYGIYLFFRRTRESENPCDSCVSGCDLKDMMEKKRQECGVKKKSTNFETTNYPQQFFFVLFFFTSHSLRFFSIISFSSQPLTQLSQGF